MRINRKTIRQSRYPITSAVTRSILVLLLAGGLLSSDAQAATLTVSDVTHTAAALTISDHTGAWWYRYKYSLDDDFGPCTAVSGSTVRLSGLTAPSFAPFFNVYDVSAFSESTCTTVVASETIRLHTVEAYYIKPTGATISFESTVHYHGIQYGGIEWWYKGDQNGASCTQGDSTERITGLQPATTYTYRFYDKAGCATADEVARKTFTTEAAGTTELMASNVTATEATLTITGHTGPWWLRYNIHGGNCRAIASGQTSFDLIGQRPGDKYNFWAYDKDGCGEEDRIASETWRQLYVGAWRGTTTALLMLSDWAYTGGAAWWHKNEDGGACGEVAAGTMRANLTNLTPNTSYNWRLYSKSGCALADTIARVAFKTYSAPTTAPKTPSSVALARANGSLTASWPAVDWPASVDGKTTYHVTYSSDGGASWSLAAANHPHASITNASITISNVTNSATYLVAVRARNAHGYSGWRNSPSVGPFEAPTPATPSSVSVTRADGSLTASWPTVSFATSYHVTYSSDGGASWSLAAANHPHASITISDVTNSATYLVAVRARNDQGDSGWRNSPAAGPFTPPPAAPSGLTAHRRRRECDPYLGRSFRSQHHRLRSPDALGWRCLG